MTLIADSPGKLTTLGEMLEKGYSPQRVFRYQVVGPNAISLVVVFAGDATIVAHVVGIGEIGPDSYVPFLTIVGGHGLEEVLNGYILTGASPPLEIPWLGYASGEDYWTAPLLHAE
jgi:hypothetical protein